LFVKTGDAGLNIWNGQLWNHQWISLAVDLQEIACLTTISFLGLRLVG
jgi:hypothetical protein